MDKAKAIEKVKALQRLVQSTTHSEEADTAKRIIERLKEQYNIRDDDLVAKQDNITVIPIDNEVIRVIFGPFVSQLFKIVRDDGSNRS